MIQVVKISSLLIQEQIVLAADDLAIQGAQAFTDEIKSI